MRHLQKGRYMALVIINPEAPLNDLLEIDAPPAHHQRQVGDRFLQSRASSDSCFGKSCGARPPYQASLCPSRPASLKRCTQSRKVWRDSSRRCWRHPLGSYREAPPPAKATDCAVARPVKREPIGEDSRPIVRPQFNC